MSCVPYTTQIRPPTSIQTQASQNTSKFTLVYTDLMSQYHTDHMNSSGDLLQSSGLLVECVHESKLNGIPKGSRLFVVPYANEKLITTIRNHFKMVRSIYTARCIKEALQYRQIALPARSLAISVAMVDCMIFLTKSLNFRRFLNRIFEMSGTVIDDFKDPRLNVVVTDKADDKYCTKARNRNVTVVTREWVDETYAALKNDDSNINHDAFTMLSTYQIKPFHNLVFKIVQKQLNKDLKDLICNNGGRLVFGQNEDITHVVESFYPEDDSCSDGPRKVDIEFLRACDREGYYMHKKEYREYRTPKMVHVKQERLSPTQSEMHQFRSNDCFTPPQQNPRSTLSSIKSNGFERNEISSMAPPLSSMAQKVSKPKVQQRNKSTVFTDDDLTRARLSFENSTQQTQLVSTQIRRLPESEIRFERTTESSQQLSWCDSICRRR
jgi:hypothetical protein